MFWQNVRMTPPHPSTGPSQGKSPAGRFSGRVADYVKYRPGYPVEILDLLASQCGLTPESVVADIGSGTGKLSQLFLENGNLVYGVEPNTGMREAAEQLFAEYATFESVDGSAELTRLPDECCDLIVAGQAFHWFKPEYARREFARILRSDGFVALIWNDRKTEGSAFSAEYDELLTAVAPDYRKTVDHKQFDIATLAAFFGGPFRETQFPYSQAFDQNGLIGRAASSSYFPPRNSNEFAAAVAKLITLFERFAKNNRVTFEYTTRVFYGKLV